MCKCSKKVKDMKISRPQTSSIHSAPLEQHGNRQRVLIRDATDLQPLGRFDNKA